MSPFVFAFSVFVALLVGYGMGLIHCFYAHWGRAKIYCPRCSYYMKWADTMLKDLFPNGWKIRDRFPW
jgi:hypothetical protein